MAESTFTFPYQYIEIEEGKILNPLLKVSVKASFGWQDLWFLLDSGADTTMLTTSLADKLGLSYDKKKSTILHGIGENTIKAYPGSIVLKLGDKEMMVRVYFSSENESTLLLGRLDIFDTFDIVFQISTQHIVFKRI